MSLPLQTGERKSRIRASPQIPMRRVRARAAGRAAQERNLYFTGRLRSPTYLGRFVSIATLTNASRIVPAAIENGIVELRGMIAFRAPRILSGAVELTGKDSELVLRFPVPL